MKRIIEGIREGEELSLIDLVQTSAQRAIVDDITAVMSLLEGHADVVMDSVGPDVVPSVAEIRDAFRRRAREVHLATWIVAALFVIRFAFFME